MSPVLLELTLTIATGSVAPIAPVHLIPGTNPVGAAAASNAPTPAGDPDAVGDGVTDGPMDGSGVPAGASVASNVGAALPGLVGLETVATGSNDVVVDEQAAR